MRASGILLPISSLPNSYGIGTFGKEAYAFIDFLKKCHQSYWQILPLGPVAFGDSPYQTYSTFAGDGNYLDLESLYEDGLLTKDELDSQVVTNTRVDYDELRRNRMPLYKKLTKRFFANLPPDYDVFYQNNQEWLRTYCTYMALKTYYQGDSFNKWPTSALKNKLPKTVKAAILEDEKMHAFIQYTFFKQWYKLKAYANRQGIKIIGDLPIYVAYDSADVWSNPQNFELDENYQPLRVAGCPPDAFSKDGQLWGNPLYNYEEMAKDHFSWWIKRFAMALTLFDMVRIDHFRGFESYFAIPYGEKTARNGVWVKAPGLAIFNELKRVLGSVNLIAEDLGFLTPAVYQLLKQTGFPGMRVLEFAFDGNDNNAYLPHNYLENTVVYTGTHDNLPLAGWVKTLSNQELECCYKFTHCLGPKELPKQIVKMAMGSIANLAITPLQDYLELDATARINTPGTVGINWKWRLDGHLLTNELIEYIRNLTIKYYR